MVYININNNIISLTENKISAGICKTCGGQDTIFGTWSIAHPAKDCGDLQTAIETRRDIFRREMMFVKKQQRLEQLRLLQTNGAADNKEADIANESSTTTSRG